MQFHGQLCCWHCEFLRQFLFKFISLEIQKLQIGFAKAIIEKKKKTKRIEKGIDIYKRLIQGN